MRSFQVLARQLKVNVMSSFLVCLREIRYNKFSLLSLIRNFDPFLQLNQSRTKRQRDQEGLPSYNLLAKMMLCMLQKIWIIRFSNLLCLSSFRFVWGAVANSRFSFFQDLDGRVIYVEVAKPKKQGCPRTSGPPPRQQHLQSQQEEVSDCWY